MILSPVTTRHHKRNEVQRAVAAAAPREFSFSPILPPSRTGRALCLSGRHTAASRTMVHKSVQLGCWMQRTRMLGCIGLFVSVLPVPHWTEVFLLLNAPYKMEAEIGSFDILSWLRLLPCATRLSRNASCILFWVMARFAATLVCVRLVARCD